MEQLKSAVFYYIKKKFTDEENEEFKRNVLEFNYDNQARILEDKRHPLLVDPVKNFTGKSLFSQMNPFNNNRKRVYEKVLNDIQNAFLKIITIQELIVKIKPIYDNNYVPNKKVAEYYNQLVKAIKNAPNDVNNNDDVNNDDVNNDNPVETGGRRRNKSKKSQRGKSKKNKGGKSKKNQRKSKKSQRR